MKKYQTKNFAKILGFFFVISILLSSFSGVEIHNLFAEGASTTNNKELFAGRAFGEDDETLHDYTRLDEISNQNPAAITVFVHGQGGNASNWSNDGNRNFVYDSESLIEKLRSDAEGANVYWARMELNNQNNNAFYLNKLEVNTTGSQTYYNTIDNTLDLSKRAKYVLKLEEEDVSKHIIIVFESARPVGYHREVAKELHTVIDRISYDYLELTGDIPCINLISHSRGGIISMMYATGYRQYSKTDTVLYDIDIGAPAIVGETCSNNETGLLVNDHPFNVKSLYSTGTPYNGTKMNQPWAKGILPWAFGNECAGNINDPIIQQEIQSNWNATCYVNPNLKLYANAGEISLNYVIGLLCQAKTKIIPFIDPNQISVFKTEVEKFCTSVADLIPTLQQIVQFINGVTVVGECASFLLPPPYNAISFTAFAATHSLTEIILSQSDYILALAIAMKDANTSLGDKIEILGGILLHYQRIFDACLPLILFGTSIFLETGIASLGDAGDFFISTDSQLAVGFNKVNPYKKIFDYEGIQFDESNYTAPFSYNSCNFTIEKTSIKHVPIPHNLETYDSEIQNRIRDNILLEKANYSNPLQISLATGSTTGNWKVMIKNISSQESTVVYNERMCFEDHAKNFEHLTNLRSFKLSPNGTRVITITGNGTAQFIAVAVSYFLPPANNTFYSVTYADGLNASNLTMNTPKHSVVACGTQWNADLVPNYLGLQVKSKSGITWNIRLLNSNNQQISVTYNSKMCFDDAARNFYGLMDLVDITIPANGYKDVQITENYVACFITATINYMVDGVRYRRISSADGLTTANGGGINPRREHEVLVASSFPERTSIPSYVSMIPYSRSGFIFYTWGIRITNNNYSSVEVSYNSKLCNENDAKDFINLGDIVTIVIPSRSSRDVVINHNGTAGWIVASLNYSYNGYEYRRVTYANGLAINPYRTNALKHNSIRYSL